MDTGMYRNRIYTCMGLCHKLTLYQLHHSQLGKTKYVIKCKFRDFRIGRLGKAKKFEQYS